MITIKIRMIVQSYNLKFIIGRVIINFSCNFQGIIREIISHSFVIYQNLPINIFFRLKYSLYKQYLITVFIELNCFNVKGFKFPVLYLTPK